MCVFGADRVRGFCVANNIDVIVRAHECGTPAMLWCFSSVRQVVGRPWTVRCTLCGPCAVMTAYATHIFDHVTLVLDITAVSESTRRSAVHSSGGWLRVFCRRASHYHFFGNKLLRIEWQCTHICHVIDNRNMSNSAQRN